MTRCIIDKVTDQPRGSAFVKFSTPEVAAKAVEEASSSLGVNIKDRRIRIDLAVTRDKAQLLTNQVKRIVSKDKRNMYLIKEGLLVPKDTNNEDIATKDKYLKLLTEKRKKLQNPLFFISPTRLVIREFGKDMINEKLLKIIKNAMIKGIDEKLVTLTDLENQAVAQGEVDPSKTIIPPIEKKSLKSVKIMLDFDKVRNGLPQSRGFAFAEFTHHSHALACLRYVSKKAQEIYSNESVKGNKKPLIAEFTVENIRKVQILNARKKSNVKEDNTKEPSDRVSGIKRKKTIKKEDNIDLKETINDINTDDSSNEQILKKPRIRPNKKTLKQKKKEVKDRIMQRRREKVAMRKEAKLMKTKSE